MTYAQPAMGCPAMPERVPGKLNNNHLKENKTKGRASLLDLLQLTPK